MVLDTKKLSSMELFTLVEAIHGLNATIARLTSERDELAEEVVGLRVTASTALAQESSLRRERDEARAEVERLRTQVLDDDEWVQRLSALRIERDNAKAYERMRWRLSDLAATSLLNLAVRGPKTVEAEEIIARCVVPALGGCPKCGACLMANIDCDLCDAVYQAWRATRDRLAATGDDVRLPGDDAIEAGEHDK